MATRIPPPARPRSLAFIALLIAMGSMLAAGFYLSITHQDPHPDDHTTWSGMR